MQLTEHFSEQELDVDGADPRVIQNAQYLCSKILEPIRDQFQSPLIVTSGFRNSSHNSDTGGVSNSEHLYRDDHAAADFRIQDVPLTHVFNWIRLLSGLDFRQVILEHNAEDIPQCIHISTRRAGNDKREALIGRTHGQGGYTSVEVK